MKRRKMRNTKGLSTIVATLIIILLTLVAVAIIWGVINGVLKSGSSQVDISSKCLSVDIEAVSVTNTTTPRDTSTEYDVILSRTSTGEPIDGIKVNVINSTGDSSGLMEFGPLTVGERGKVTLDTSDPAVAARPVANGSSIEFTPYFLDSSGTMQLCSNTQTYNF